MRGRCINEGLRGLEASEMAVLANSSRKWLEMTRELSCDVGEKQTNEVEARQSYSRMWGTHSLGLLSFFLLPSLFLNWWICKEPRNFCKRKRRRNTHLPETGCRNSDVGTGEWRRECREMWGGLIGRIETPTGIQLKSRVYKESSEASLGTGPKVRKARKSIVIV